MSDEFEKYGADNTDPRVYYSSSAYTAPADTSGGAKQARAKRHICRRIIGVFLCIAVIITAVYVILAYRVVISHDDGLNIKIYKRYLETPEKSDNFAVPGPITSYISSKTENGNGENSQPGVENEGSQYNTGKDYTLNLVENGRSEDKEAFTIGQIYEKCAPSVVSVSCTGSDDGDKTGSGVIISENGYIITNAELISGASSINIAVYGGADYDACTVGEDRISGVAVLKIDGAGFTAAEFGDFSKAEVGDSALSIVNPIDKSFSIVSGIVSSKEQVIDYEGYKISVFQTGAQSGSGCSGSPVINSDGQVIGILNHYMTESYSLENLCFALPMNTVKPIVEEILEKGYVSGRPSFGMEFRDLPLSVAIYYGLPVGVFVNSVSYNSDAYTRGISRGDVIVSINGASITSAKELDRVKNSLNVGDTVVLGVYRGREVYSVEVALVDIAEIKN